MKFFYALLLICTAVMTGNAQCLVSTNQDTFAITCGDTVHVIGTQAATIILNENFNNGLGSSFGGLGGQATGDPCVAHPDGTDYIYFTDPAPRQLESTSGYDVSYGGTIYFDFRMAIQGQQAPCEGPDLTNEGLHIEYNTAGGVGPSWNSITYFEPNTSGSFNAQSPGSGDYTAWATYAINIPPAAFTSDTYFRFWQDGSSGPGFDAWFIDNIVIAANTPAALYNWGNGWTTNNDTVFTPTTSGTYVLQFTDGIDTCSTTYYVDVPTPTIEAYSQDTFICAGDSTTLNINGTGLSSNGIYSWTPTSGINNPSAPSTMVSPTGNTTYTINYTVPSQPSCSASDDITIISARSYSMQTGTTDSIYCLSEDVHFYTSISIPDNYTYTWNLIDNSGQVVATNFDSEDTVAAPYITSTIGAGTYKYRNQVRNPQGCTRRDSVMLTIHQGFAPDFTVSSDQTINTGDSTLITATESSSIPGTTTAWSPAAYCSTPTANSTYAYPPSTMYMRATLTEPTYGCNTSDSVLITVNNTNGIGAIPLSNTATYPNPANTHFSLQLPENGPADVLIYDQTGRLVQQTTLASTATETVSVAALASGVYWVQIQTKKEQYSARVQVVR